MNYACKEADIKWSAATEEPHGINSQSLPLPADFSFPPKSVSWEFGIRSRFMDIVQPPPPQKQKKKEEKKETISDYLYEF